MSRSTLAATAIAMAADRNEHIFDVVGVQAFPRICIFASHMSAARLVHSGSANTHPANVSLTFLMSLVYDVSACHAFADHDVSIHV
jgi:hypothetical protein